MSDFETQSFQSNNTTLRDTVMSGDLGVGGNLSVGGSSSMGNTLLESRSQSINTSTVSTTRVHSLGSQYKSGGKTFRYVSFLAGSATMANPGAVVQSPVFNAVSATCQIQVANAVAAAGDTAVTFTVLGGFTIVANAFAGGTLIINDSAVAASQGTSYNIISNTGGAVTCTLTLDPNTPLIGALQAGGVGTDEVTVLSSIYNGVVIGATTTSTGVYLGGLLSVMTTDGANDQFGWIQTNGPGVVMAGATLTVLAGDDLVMPGAAVGGVGLSVDNEAVLTKVAVCTVTPTVDPAVNEGIACRWMLE